MDAYLIFQIGQYAEIAENCLEMSSAIMDHYFQISTYLSSRKIMKQPICSARFI